MTIIRDYGAVCLALSVAGAAYWVICEWMDEHLYQEHLYQVFETKYPSFAEIERIWR